MNDQIACSDLEWYHDSLEQEEVPKIKLEEHPKACVTFDIPPSCESESLVDISSSEADKRGRDGQICYHLSHADGNRQNKEAPDGKGNEEAGRSAIDKSAADLDVECRSNSA